LVSSSAITEVIALLLYTEFVWYCVIGIRLNKDIVFTPNKAQSEIQRFCNQRHMGYLFGGKCCSIWSHLLATIQFRTQCNGYS